MCNENDLVRRGDVRKECLKMSFYPALVNAALMRTNAVDAVEVVRGRWIPVIDEYPQVLKMPMLVGYKCSVCGRYEEQEEPYCHCGAKMDGGEIDGKKTD